MDEGMNNIYKAIGSLVLLIGIAFSVYLYFDNRYAQCSDLQVVEMRLDYKIESDVLNSMRDRLWMLEEKCSLGNCSASEKKEVKDLKEEIDIQKEKVREIQKQMFKGRA